MFIPVLDVLCILVEASTVVTDGDGNSTGRLAGESVAEFGKGGENADHPLPIGLRVFLLIFVFLAFGP